MRVALLNSDAGLSFARFAKSIAIVGGSIGEAAEFAEKQFPNDLPLNRLLKAAVAAGSTGSGSWAENGGRRSSIRRFCRIPSSSNDRRKVWSQWDPAAS